MNKQKVVLVVPSFGVGGAENMVCQLAKEINADKYDVQILCLSPKQHTLFEQELQDGHIDVTYLNNVGKLSLKTVFLVWRFLSQFKPDIIHTHLHASLYVFPWLSVHSTKCLHTIHSTPKFEFSPRLIKLMGKLYRYKRVIPVAISKRIKEEASHLYKLPPNEIELIVNPVNIAKFQRISITNKDSIRFINVARLEPIKNQRLLLKAFSNIHRELPNATLFIVGDGSERSALEDYATSLGIQKKVFFTGNIGNVEDFLSSSDIFVLTSIYEGLPLSILEAMASGLPIISTNVGGIADVIFDNGILVESEDLQGLSEAMLELSRDHEKRKRMSMSSLESVKAYDISQVTRSYEELYTKYG